jgi:hypothetical protein
MAVAVVAETVIPPTLQAPEEPVVVAPEVSSEFLEQLEQLA